MTNDPETDPRIILERMNRAERLSDKMVADFETILFLSQAADLPNKEHVAVLLRLQGDIARAAIKAVEDPL